MSKESKSKTDNVCNNKESPPADTLLVREPPRTLGATLLRLGPGMIIAGSIVGSGELIATRR